MFITVCLMLQYNEPASSSSHHSTGRLAAVSQAEGIEPVKAVFERRRINCKGDPEPILASHNTS